MRALALGLVAAIAAGGAVAQELLRIPPTLSRAWGASMAVPAVLCGVRDATWGEALPRALLHDAARHPSGWGIETRSTARGNYPDLDGLNRARGAIAMAITLGELLHARIPREMCSDARQFSAGYDVTEGRNAREFVVPPLPEPVAQAGTLAFVATLAAEWCRLRRPEWLEDALPQILSRIREAPAPPESDPKARPIFLATMGGAEAMAVRAPTLARKFARQVCSGLATWPELHQADAAAEEGRRLRTRPGGVGRDMQPIQ